MKNFTAEYLQSNFSYPKFIPFLSRFLSKKINVPQRNHLDMGENTLLLMPAWDEQFCGVKTATACPGNRALGKPTIHAVYTLFDVKTGEPLAQMDGKILTNKRTAAASALASQHLSRPASTRLLVLGNGALCPELIHAHAAVRPISEVEIWGRNLERVKTLIEKNEWGKLRVLPCKNLPKAANEADIISCCTGTVEPILKGKWLRLGTHLDLVGSYRPDMREADDEAIRRTKIYVDNPTALFECGDISIPLRSGILNENDIRGTLADLSLGKCEGRISENEITLFKSVGFALEDLAAAVFILWQHENL